MYVDFYRTEHPQPAIQATLSTVYCLHADPSYTVHHPPLQPDRFVLLYTVSGNGSLQVNAHHYTLCANDFVLFQPHTDYFSYFCASSNWSFWWFEFSAQTALMPEQKYNLPLDDTLSDLCKKSLAFLKQEDSRSASTVFCCLLALLESQTSLAKPLDSVLERIQKSDHYIRKHLATVNVESLAAYLDLNVRTIRTSFQKAVGCSPKEYMQQVKLDSSRYLLESSQMSVGKIAEELGYSSQFHFSRVFKERFGVSPMGFRKICRGGQPSI